MRRLIFAAVFFIVSLVQNFAAATELNDVDWSSAPRFSNYADFTNHLKNCMANLQTEIPVVLTNGLDANNAREILDGTGNLAFAYRYKSAHDGDSNLRVLYEFLYYPGTKIVHAHRTGDTSILSNEEKKLYNLAVKIVNDARAQPTVLRKELFIHDAITTKTTYYTATISQTFNLPRFVTATGALLDGRANCQGYSDAFYMLGNMSGLNVGKISGVFRSDDGKGRDEGHMWNTIDFGGVKYFVDVTGNDDSFKFSRRLGYNSYIYFNAPAEIASATHSWRDNMVTNLQAEPDDKYFFTTPEFAATNGDYFGFYSRSTEKALDEIARRIAVDRRKLSWAMIPHDEKFNLEKALNRLVREILPSRYQYYRGYFGMAAANRGKYTLLFVDVRNKRR